MSTLLKDIPRKRKGRPAVFDQLHHNPVEGRSADITFWAAQSRYANTPPLDTEPPQATAQPSKRRRILQDISYNTRTMGRETRAQKGRQQPKAGHKNQEGRGRNQALLEDEAVGIASDAVAAATQRVPVMFNPPASSISYPSRRSGSRSQSPRKGIIRRGDLVHLEPRIDMLAKDLAEEEGYMLNESVVQLWERIRSCDQSDFSVVEHIEEEDRSFVRRILDFAIRQADDCRQDTHPEAQWISKVVLQILNIFEQTTPGSASNRRANDRVGVFDVRTTEIISEHVPTSNKASLKDLDKKIDLALGLCLARETKKLLQSRLTSINQASSFVNYNPLFLNIEVKRSYGNEDPVVQLGAWAAAEFNKRWMEEWDMSMPSLALEIDGDIWRLHAVAARVFEDEGQKDFELAFIGPLKLGSTEDKQSLNKLFVNLNHIVEWARTEYLSWFEEAIVRQKPRE